MATTHTVKQGEHLSRIAQQYGFADYRIIWDHPKNAELKRKRQNPNVLFPGDRLFIPDKQEKQEARATTQVHKFQKPSQTVLLRLVLKNLDDQPLANTECKLDVEGKVFQLTTDGSGKIEQEVPKTAEKAKLTFKDSHVPLDIEIVKIGHLDPVEEASGQRARLANLGYYLGALDKPAEAQLRSAIEEFQCDNNLTVDGVCGPQTQAKLKEVHGC